MATVAQMSWVYIEHLGSMKDVFASHLIRSRDTSYTTYHSWHNKRCISSLVQKPQHIVTQSNET